MKKNSTTNILALKILPAKLSHKLLIIIGCVILPIFIYAKSINAPFLFDDFVYIVNNPTIQSFTLDPALKNFNKIQMSRPLTFLTFAANFKVNNLNQSGFHIVNLLIHLLVVFSIYIFKKIIIFQIYNKSSDWIPFVSAIIFSIHPLHTEVVAYISHRSESLATLFYLIAIISFINAIQGNNKYFILSILSFGASLASKEIASTLPAMLLLVDYLIISNMDFRSVLKRIHLHLVYWGMLVCFIILRILVTGGIGDPDPHSILIWTRYSYFITQIYVVAQYIKLLIIPIGQCIDHFIVPRQPLFNFSVLISLVALFVMSVPVFLLRSNRNCFRVILLGYIWFFVTLLPTSSILPIQDAMVERRMYLPSIGIFIYITGIVIAIVLKGDKFENFSDKLRNSFIPVFAGVYLLMLLVLINQRLNLYLNPMFLWKEAISMYPTSFRALNNLGNYYRDNGQIDDAIDMYKKASSIKPDFADSYYNLGAIYFNRKQYEIAINYLNLTIKINPRYDIAYCLLGRSFFESNNYDKAIQPFELALSVNPKYCDPLYYLGFIYSFKNDYIRGINYYEKLISINPNYVEAYNDLGNAYSEVKRFEDALKCYQKAVELIPQYAGSYFNIGSLYEEMGDLIKSRKYYDIALKLDPTNREYLRAINDSKSLIKLGTR